MFSMTFRSPRRPVARNAGRCLFAALASVGLWLVLAPAAAQKPAEPSGETEPREGSPPPRQADRPAAAAAEQIAAESGAASTETTERGKYLVHHVAMCVQCHSPRDQEGRLIEERLLQGGRIPVSKPFENMAWALQPPRLAGLQVWSDDAVVTLLTTGRMPQRTSPRPPMPPFRLSPEDAQAVVHYLRSVE